MATSGSTLEVTTPNDLEIVMTRTFRAPRDLVFEAHGSCEHLAKWWGPRRYELSFCDVDFRVGGAWRMVQRGSDGQEFGFHGEYREIVRSERITWTFEFEGAPGHVAVETVTFEEEDGVTTLTATSRHETKEARDAVLASGMTEGAAETWDRLDEYVQELAARAMS